MNGTSRLTSVLLDKSVVREALRATVRRRQGQALPERQALSLDAILVCLGQDVPVFVTTELLHILLRPHMVHVSRALLPSLRLLAPGRYLKRWARRLREEGFSREDAVIVSHGSFGVDEATGSLGAEAVLTTDYALQDRYERQHVRIANRFARMTQQLKMPYRDATLPSVLRPAELLERLLG